MTSSVQSWRLKWGVEHSLDSNNKLGVLTEQFLKNLEEDLIIFYSRNILFLFTSGFIIPALSPNGFPE